MLPSPEPFLISFPSPFSFLFSSPFALFSSLSPSPSIAACSRHTMRRRRVIAARHSPPQSPSIPQCTAAPAADRPRHVTRGKNRRSIEEGGGSRGGRTGRYSRIYGASNECWLGYGRRGTPGEEYEICTTEVFVRYRHCGKKSA